ncbi:putative protein kinase RLK-Pelle-RLCK-Os family [Helianthus debilis subsp. tardiflorus]
MQKKNASFIPLNVARTIEDMEREKPIRFTAKQPRIATNNFNFELGSGGFGMVYKGVPSNGVTLAVKVLNGSSDQTIEEQFIAEVSTMGRTHHFNLVRLYGFCFEKSLIAIIYEFMDGGTPGYATPELWMPLPVTHKCDVYSFGMLLFEIIGRRRNMDVTLGDSQQWFPVSVWDKYEKKTTERFDGCLCD